MDDAISFLKNIELEGSDFKKDLSCLEVEEQIEILKISCEEFYPEDEIYKKLHESIKNNKPLNIKFGIDPLSMDLHIGDIPPLVLSGKLQRMGHSITVLMGDATAVIGDPFRSWDPKELNRKNIEKNLKQLRKQLDNFLDFGKVSTLYNSSWLDDVKLPEIIDLMNRVNITELLRQGDFTEKLEKNEAIPYAKLLYPFMMGMDSIRIKPDIEIGASNQSNSFHMCRQMMKAIGLEPELIMTTYPISQAHSISINSNPVDIFSLVSKVDKDSIYDWFRLLTEVMPGNLISIKNYINEGKINLQAIREVLAKIIISRMYDRDSSDSAYIEYMKELVKNSKTQEVAMISGNVKFGEFIAASTELTLAEADELIHTGGVNALSCDGKCLSHIVDCDADINSFEFDKFYIIISDRLILSIKK